VFISAKQNIKAAQLSATIIRANGTKEELGVIDYYSSNPLKMLLFKVKKAVKGLLAKK
jgi:hypothetical protein